MSTITKKPTNKLANLSPDNALNLDNLFEASEPSHDDMAIDNLLSEFASVESAEVKIYRVLPNNKLSYIYAVHPSEFRFDDLRDVYKGGKFRTFIYGVEEGKKVLRASPQFEVEKVNEIESPAIVSQNNDINMLGQMMIQGFQKLGEIIVQTSANSARIVDPDEAEAKYMQKMVIMKQLFNNPQPIQQQQHENTDFLTKSLDMLTKGIEMGKSLQAPAMGEASSTDVLLETVKGLAPVLMTALANNQNTQAQKTQIQEPVIPQIPHIPQIQQNPTIDVQIKTQGENEMNVLQKIKLKAGLAFLVDAAQRNLDIDTYANIALDSLSDTELDEIFTNENPVEFFAQFEPRINDNKLWFEKLLNSIKEVLTFGDDEINNANNSLTIELPPENAINEPASKSKIKTEIEKI